MVINMKSQKMFSKQMFVQIDLVRNSTEIDSLQ